MQMRAYAVASILIGLYAACSTGGPAQDQDDTHGLGGERQHAAGMGGRSGASATGGSGLSSGGVSAGAGGSSAAGAAAGDRAIGGASGAAHASGGSSDAPGEAGQNTAGAAGAGSSIEQPEGLSWPIDCVPDETCVGLGYPDTNEDGQAHDCGEPGYFGHQGTDIAITEEAQAAGTAVRAAADGIVLFAFDGKYDQCPSTSEPDCQAPPTQEPGGTTGNTVCTPIGPYCGTGEPGCYWCFAGGNVIVIRHEGVPGVFATRYDHLKRSSVLVRPGDTVVRGQKIAEAGSSGNSSGPHLHFEVWGTGFYELADPWAGTCGPNTGPSLWAHNPPWSSL